MSISDEALGIDQKLFLINNRNSAYCKLRPLKKFENEVFVILKAVKKPVVGIYKLLDTSLRSVWRFIQWSFRGIIYFVFRNFLLSSIRLIDGNPINKNKKFSQINYSMIVWQNIVYLIFCNTNNTILFQVEIKYFIRNTKIFILIHVKFFFWNKKIKYSPTSPTL
jgi:hypothetical protein